MYITKSIVATLNGIYKCHNHVIRTKKKFHFVHTSRVKSNTIFNWNTLSNTKANFFNLFVWRGTDPRKEKSNLQKALMNKEHFTFQWAFSFFFYLWNVLFAHIFVVVVLLGIITAVSFVLCYVGALISTSFFSFHMSTFFPIKNKSIICCRVLRSCFACYLSDSKLFPYFLSN